jgi:hypothetical protein
MGADLIEAGLNEAAAPRSRLSRSPKASASPQFGVGCMPASIEP